LQRGFLCFHDTLIIGKYHCIDKIYTIILVFRKLEKDAKKTI